MRTNYPPRNSRKLRPKLLAEALVVLFVLILVRFFGFSGSAAEPVFSVARPLLYARRFFVERTMAITQFFRNEASLIAENKELKAQLSAAQIALVDHAFMREEYRSLVASLGRQLAEPAAVFASVLLKPPQTPYDTLVIDVGRREGIAVGDEVFAGPIPVGAIVEVFSKSSKAILFSSPGKERTVMVGDGALAVTAHGEGGGSFTLSLPRDIPLKEGDPVFLPGTPPLLFGKVGSVEARPTDSFKTALVRGPINTAQLRFVRIIKTDRIQ